MGCSGDTEGCGTLCQEARGALEWSFLRGGYFPIRQGEKGYSRTRDQ